MNATGPWPAARMILLPLTVAVALQFGGVGTARGASVTLEEVVVTARRVNESLASIPMAVNVVERPRLTQGAFDGLQSLAMSTPGLYFESMWGGDNSAVVLRGQSQPSTAGDNVGIFVDGVYQAARYAVDVDTLDIERVEVARGPQNTLFGHSTFAGAVHFVTAEPGASSESSVSIGAGSDGYLAVSGMLSGPIGDGPVSMRLSAGASNFDGTGRNVAAPGQSLGAIRRRAAALVLATTDDLDWYARLSVRMMQRDSGHPLAGEMTYDDYNCGSIDPASGAWSYFCGKFPVRSSFDISPALPDSAQDTGQVSFHLQWPLAGLVFESDTSYYRSSARLIRDFDGSSAGDLFGVCTLDSNCSGLLGPPRIVDRLIFVNEVQRQLPEVTEVSQDVRLRQEAENGIRWLVGLTAFETDEVMRTQLGVDGSGLNASERLTSYLPRTPMLVGPVSAFNRALVPDPDNDGVEQTLTRDRTRTLAVYGSVDWDIASNLRSRVEVRATRERKSINSVTANFLPSFGKAIRSLDFTDVTPRVSVDYQQDGSMVYVSAAKGSRSGGVNPIPGLLPEEQGFEPEYNWTYELGGHYTASGGRLDAMATAFYVDWRNVQITGFSNTPGVGNLILRNARGITTRGMEFSASVVLGAGWRADLGGSLVDARFRASTDDPGSGRFCGLSANNTTSTFCTVGPPRTFDSSSVALVPYVDGNRLQRAPKRTWQAGLEYAGMITDEWDLTARVNLRGQDDVFDRAIGGARYGSRVQCDAGIHLVHGRLSIDLWSLNLTDERYVAAAASRGAVYFPTTPRPLDLLYGPGRRLGVTFSYRSGTSTPARFIRAGA